MLVRFAPVDHQVTPALLYFYDSTKNLMRILLYYKEFFREFFVDKDIPRNNWIDET